MHTPTRSGRRTARARRGSALVLVLVMTVALAALALSAIYLSAHGSLVTKAFDREREYRYATEAALAMGRARLTEDANLVLHDSLPTTLLTDASLSDASGNPLPGVRLNMWVARSGSKTGEHGLYASVIAEARDANGGGAKFVRRLELMEENFARFLDWSDRWARNGCYGTGEVMDGPVFSNARVGVCGGHFRDTVASASTVDDNGIFDKGQLENQRRIELPSLDRLARLENYARSGHYYIDAPTTGDATGARLRIEFVWLDLNGDGDAVGPEDAREGFFRVFRANNANRNRADYRQGGDDVIKDEQCGDWHVEDGEVRFFPYKAHNSGSWFENSMKNGTNRQANHDQLGYPWDDATDVVAHRAMTRAQIMRSDRGRTIPPSSVTPRCFPAGDPHLAATEATPAVQRGGTARTFDPTPSTGEWLRWPGPAVNWNAFPAANRPPVEMQPYLWPLDRALNPGTKGVIYVNGTVALHGKLRGRVTVYATGDITFVDDLRYSVNPSSDQCMDMLGVISQRKITIADNGINSPQDPVNGGDDGNTWMDDDMHFYLDGVLMALDTFVPERWNAGAVNMSWCNGQSIGRGCLYQVGGAIVRNREVTYDGSHGYMESRTYDRRMNRDSPPYFPTTGRYFDNRFYEVDPLGFDITSYLRRIGQSGS